MIECCETCVYYRTECGMPVCRKNDITEEHPDEEKCGDYVQQPNEDEYFLSLMNGGK